MPSFLPISISLAPPLQPYVGRQNASNRVPASFRCNINLISINFALSMTGSASTENTMLALQKSKQPLGSCSPNVLPCRIHYNGPSKVTKRFWSPSLDKDKNRTAYFRGRKLRGRTVKLPDGYEGIVASSTDRVVPDESVKTWSAVPVESDLENLDDEEEEATEPIKIFEAIATFDEINVWAHDQIPATDDTFVKGVEEWIAFAEAIHSAPTADDLSDKSST